MLKKIKNFFMSFIGGPKQNFRLGLYGPPNSGKTTLANKICIDWLGEEQEQEAILLSIRDVSDQQKLEHELKSSEEKFRNLVDQAYDSIICVDDDGRIEFVNKHVEKTFGYKREEVIGREMAEVIIPPRMRDAHSYNRSWTDSKTNERNI